MDDRPEISDEVTTPAQPVLRPGNTHVRGFGEGFAVAIVLLLLAGAAGFVAVARPAGSTAPSPSSVAAVETTSTAAATPTIAPTLPPTPGPIVTPTTPCAARPPADPPIALIHSEHDGSRWRYSGTPTSSSWLVAPAPSAKADAPAEATIVLATPLVVTLDNRWCALAWRFTIDGVPIGVQDNPGLDPGVAAQDAWSIRVPALADPAPILRAELAFAAGWTIDEWRLTFTPPAIPDAFVSGLDSTVSASPGCGFTIKLSDGVEGAGSCATSLPTDQPDPLLVPPGTRLAFRIPTVAFVPDPDVPVICGHVSGAVPEFQTDPACEFDQLDDPSNALTFSAPSTAGTWWFALQGCATRDGNQACGRWYAIVDTTQAAPTDTAGGG